MNGGHVGSVSVMGRLCASEMVGAGSVPAVGARERKKSRLDAMAASRERELASDSDSEGEKMNKAVKAAGKRKPFRSLTNSVTRIEPLSLPPKGEESEQEFLTANFLTETKEEAIVTKGSLNVGSISSSGMDPSSSSAANTNSR